MVFNDLNIGRKPLICGGIAAFYISPAEATKIFNVNRGRIDLSQCKNIKELWA